MKIVKAMKKIARLKGEIKELKHRIQGCISTLIENDYEENILELSKQLDNKVQELINLKVGIMEANVKGNMFRTVVGLGEFKSQMDFLKELTPKKGVQENRYSDNKTEYKSQISISEKNNLIETCQNQINNLTDILDEFNAKTDVVVQQR